MTSKSYQKQGQSDQTEFKERGLEAAFSINLRIFNAKIGSRFGDRYPYWHFDLNCGSGINEKIGCIGSPLAFLRAAESTQVPRYFAGFCDINQTSLAALKGREGVANNQDCFLFHGDNAELVDAIPDIIGAHERPHQAMGMVLSDPNGFAVPLEELAALSQACPKLDVAIHWNTRIRRLYRGQGWEFVDIDEAIAMLGKSHWLIRKPMGAHQWTVLVGRNLQVGDHRSLGFYHLDSEMGQDIMQRCKARLQDAESPQVEMEL